MFLWKFFSRPYHYDYTEYALQVAEIPYESQTNLRYRYVYYVSPNDDSIVKHGEFKAFYPNGAIASEGVYEHGLEQGVWREFYENGRLAAQGSYQNGQRGEDWLFWGEDGNAQIF